MTPLRHKNSLATPRKQSVVAAAKTMMEALQGLPQGFERRICDCEPEAQAAAVSLHDEANTREG